MRIGVLGSPWVPVPPPAYGGTETVLDTLVRGLAARGHQVAYAGHPDSDLPARIIAPVRTADIGMIGETACELAHVAQSYELLEAWGADIIHDHTLSGPLVRQGGAPSVVTHHGPFDALTTAVFEHVARRSAVVAISHSQASTAPTVPVSAVIHHGLDVAEWPVGDGGGGYLLFLGRMNATKGAHRAIEIARQVGIPLVIAAKMREPAEVAYFEDAVRPHLHSDVDFVGEADATTKRELLAGARALLNPIAWPEPFGLVMIEALACGTPVLAPPLGAVPEIVEHGVTGFLCSSTASYLAAVEAAGALDRMQCRAAVARRFSIERMVGRHERLYRRILAVRTSPSDSRVERPAWREPADHDLVGSDGDPYVVVGQVDAVPGQR